MNKLIVANWKMFLTHNDSLVWLEKHTQRLNTALEDSANHLVLCPAFTVLGAQGIRLGSRIFLGAQDCCFEEQGAYTGDISPLSLKQRGCEYVIVGHSERRQLYGETDERIAQKVQLLFKQNITPILCIGETRKERRAQLTQAVLEKQLINCIPLLSLEHPKQLIIAYEPVWAIGTGEVPSATELQEALAIIRHALGTACVKLLYGGSTDEETAAKFDSLVDGFLIGKASTDAEVLIKIILQQKTLS